MPGDSYFYVSCVPVHSHKRKFTSTSFHWVPSSGSLLNTFFSIDILINYKYEIQTRNTSGIQNPMVTPTRMCNLIFNLFLTVFTKIATRNLP